MLHRLAVVSLFLLLTGNTAGQQAAGGPTVDAGVVEAPRQKHNVPKITFDSDVDAESVKVTIALLDQLKSAEAIIIEINSDGGSVDEGFKLARAIEQSPVPVICIVDGTAASEAFFLLQSCHTRLMTARSRLMAHEPMLLLPAQTRVTRTLLEMMRKDQATAASAWTAHAGRRLTIPLKEFRQRIRHSDWWMTVDVAKKIGAIDGEVGSVEAAWSQATNDLKIKVK